MDVVLKSGTVLTEEMMGEIGDAFDRGEEPGETARVLIAPVGRPMISEEELTSMGFKVPMSWKARIDAKAALENLTRSQYLRKIVADAIF